MKPEALDAFATESLRPGALDAAAANQRETNRDNTECNMTEERGVGFHGYQTSSTNGHSPITSSPPDQPSIASIRLSVNIQTAPSLLRR